MSGQLLPENQLQPLPTQPGNDGLGFPIASGDQQWVVSASLIPDHDLLLGDFYVRGGVDEVAENVAGLGSLVTVADGTQGHVLQVCLAPAESVNASGLSSHVQTVPIEGTIPALADMPIPEPKKNAQTVPVRFEASYFDLCRDERRLRPRLGVRRPTARSSPQNGTKNDREVSQYAHFPTALRRKS